MDYPSLLANPHKLSLVQMFTYSYEPFIRRRIHVAQRRTPAVEAADWECSTEDRRNRFGSTGKSIGPVAIYARNVASDQEQQRQQSHQIRSGIDRTFHQIAAAPCWRRSGGTVENPIGRFAARERTGPMVDRRVGVVGSAGRRCGKWGEKCEKIAEI